MSARVDVVGLLMAILGACAAGFGVAGLCYLLGAPGRLAGALAGALVSTGVPLLYTLRQKRRAAGAAATQSAPRADGS